MSRLRILAEGEELSANPLRRVFNDLLTTQIAVDVDWRILSQLESACQPRSGSLSARKRTRQ
jgi:hypothetical protein